jgi:two-component system sensor histidine kinase/response regulator
LKKEGYKIYAATSGESALSFLQNIHPDLIMLDMKMEGIDGLTLCKKLKSNTETSDIPIIFVTAETSSEVIKKGFEVGCCDYVTKPFIKEEYIARVKTHLEISKQAHELKAANNELKMFCSAVSHDLKSPLNVVNMLIDTLKSELGENQTDEVLQITDMISQKSTQLIVMIERLLEFSKMCNIQPFIKSVSVENIIKSVFEELKSLESDRNIKLECADLPNINCDEVLAEILIKNIMTNAFKFTRQRSEAKIIVTSERLQNYVVISVKDNGAGFDMAYSDKLFKVFQRLHTDEEYEGSGVGLALVDRIMKRHGGRVEAVSEVNKGTEIRLYFPN